MQLEMNETVPPVVRFAPSPNGRLHLGHAYSALFTQQVARDLKARLLLRIEDIDLARCQQRFVDGIYDDLGWIGLHWEKPVRRQSEHFAVYEDALSTLKRLGVVYPCFATRKEIAEAVAGDLEHPRDPDGAPLYPGISRDLACDEITALLESDVPHAWRLDVERAWNIAGAELSFVELGSGPRGETGELEVIPQVWGDVVIARKDIKTSYHLSVVVDDALQGVSHVTRGQDLFYATYIHRLLQKLLSLPVPYYFHHPLVRDDAQRKLSKSAGDQSLAALRSAGVSAVEVRRMLGFV